MKKDKYPIDNEEDDESGGESGGSGAQTGEVEFHYRDILSTEPNDDVILPKFAAFSEQHKLQHKYLVDKQKSLRQDRKAVKEGLTTRAKASAGSGYGLSAAMGQRSDFQNHPILHTKAQFTVSIDSQVSPAAAENTANTNDDKRQELSQQHRLRLGQQLRQTHRYSYNQTPKLRR